MARIFEMHTKSKLDKMQGSHNDFLVNVINGSEVYPSVRDMDKLSPLIDKIISIGGKMRDTKLGEQHEK